MDAYGVHLFWKKYSTGEFIHTTVYLTIVSLLIFIRIGCFSAVCAILYLQLSTFNLPLSIYVSHQTQRPARRNLY